MTQRKDVANNAEQAAQDIMVYLLTYRDDVEKHKLQAELDSILELAQKEYAGENMSLFNQYFVYPVSRKRHSELTEAIARLKGCSEEQFARFTIIVDLLTNGACKSTSLNTIILDKLLAATGKYLSIREDKRLDATSSLSNDARENVREIVKGLFIHKAKECIDKQLEEKRKEEERKQLAAKVTSHIEPGRLTLTKTLIEELDRVLKGKKEKPLVQGNKLDSKLLAERHAMLSVAFSKKVKVEEKTKPISPLPMSYEETVVAVSQPPEDRPMPEPQAHSKSDPGKLNQNPAFAASLDAIGGFFAKKYQSKKAAKVQEKFADEFAAIAKHFGARK